MFDYCPVVWALPTVFIPFRRLEALSPQFHQACHLPNALIVCHTYATPSAGTVYYLGSCVPIRFFILNDRAFGNRELHLINFRLGPMEIRQVTTLQP